MNDLVKLILKEYIPLKCKSKHLVFKNVKQDDIIYSDTFPLSHSQAFHTIEFQTFKIYKNGNLIIERKKDYKNWIYLFEYLQNVYSLQCHCEDNASPECRNSGHQYKMFYYEKYMTQGETRISFGQDIFDIEIDQIKLDKKELREYFFK